MHSTAAPMHTPSSLRLFSQDFYFVALCALCSAFICHFIWARVKAFQQGGRGTYLIAVDPSHNTGFLWANPWPGRIGTLRARFSPYAKAKLMVLPTASLVTPRTIFFVADPEVVKQVASDRLGIYEKDPQTYRVLNVYGDNIVGSSTALWKRQREAARAAFSEGHAQLMWKESCYVAREAAAVLRIANSLEAINIPVFLRKLVLSAMSAGSYGRRLAYGEDTQDVTLPGFTQPFGVSLQIACENMIPKWAIPRIAYTIPIPALQRYLSRMARSYEELEKHFQQMIQETRLTLSQEDDVDDVLEKSNDLYHNNLLRKLVSANTLEKDPSKRLSDKELLSNVFIFLLAGHETSANTLSFIFGHLALYPEVQDKVYEEIKSIWPTEEDALYGAESFSEDFVKFEYTLAVIRESLRHFPVAPRLPKVAMQDTVIHSRGYGGFDPVTYAVPKGSVVLMDIMGCNANPVWWGEDASEFRPERFIDTPTYRWPRDAFLAFSAGSRSCIGQRSGQAQIIGIMANLLRAVKLELPPHLLDMPFQKRRDTLMRCWLGSSLTPTDIKLVFSPRKEEKS